MARAPPTERPVPTPMPQVPAAKADSAAAEPVASAGHKAVGESVGISSVPANANKAAGTALATTSKQTTSSLAARLTRAATPTAPPNSAPSPRPTYASGYVHKTLLKGAADPLFAKLGNAQGCYRCKFADCPGWAGCIFDSNVFPSGKILKCTYCQLVITFRVPKSVGRRLPRVWSLSLLRMMTPMMRRRCALHQCATASVAPPCPPHTLCVCAPLTSCVRRSHWSVTSVAPAQLWHLPSTQICVCVSIGCMRLCS